MSRVSREKMIDAAVQKVLRRCMTAEAAELMALAIMPGEIYSLSKHWSIKHIRAEFRRLAEAQPC